MAKIYSQVIHGGKNYQRGGGGDQPPSGGDGGGGEFDDIRRQIEDAAKRLEVAEDHIKQVVERLKEIPTASEMGHEIPIYRFSHDKNFKSQIDRGQLTLRLNTDQLKRDMSTTAGGGGGGAVQTSSYETTYVNSIGCIDDSADPDCGIPFDVTYRDLITLETDGTLTRVLQNAFVQFHEECKFMRCAASSEPDAGLDRWRPCGVEDDSEDIFLDPVIFELMPLEMVEPVILLQSPNKCYSFVEAGVMGEVATDPAPYIYIYDGCESAECPYAPCDALCDNAMTTVAANIVFTPASGPGTCTGFFPPGNTYPAPPTYNVPAQWQWDSGSFATIEVQCSGDTLLARSVLPLGGAIMGDPSNAPTYFKDVTSQVTCAGGKLSGTFTLSILNASFCGGGAPGSYDVLTVTLV